MKEQTSDTQRSTREELIFAQYPVPKAVAAMAGPTILSQVITVIYNLADTWFVGLTGDAAAVAAVSLCLPVYMMMTGLGNMFGVGGASVMARALGEKRTGRAQKTFAISFRGALGAAAGYSLLIALVARPLLMRIGGDSSNIAYALSYSYITIVIGGIPTILSSTLANLIRATGDAKSASVGITLGAVLNMALDPLFMFVLLPRGNEVTGAAIATALSNAVSMIYFLSYVWRRKGSDVFSFRARPQEESVLGDIVKCGLPSFCLVGPSMLSNCFLNGMIATMGASAAVAGIGLTRKVDSLAYAINQGITQGMLPIVSYCYASRRTERMKKVVAFSAACTMVFSILWSSISYLFAPQLIGLFIRDADTIYFGSKFLRVLCIAVAIYPVLFVIITVFQAMGDSIKPVILSLIHKGSIDIVMLFVFRALFGVEYILWVAPMMDAVALITAIILYKRKLAGQMHRS